MIDLHMDRLLAAVQRSSGPEFRGEVARVSGGLIEATSLQAAMGEMARIQGEGIEPIEAEVVGFRDGRTLLMPHDDISGVAPRQQIRALGKSFEIGVGVDLLGRTVDGFGRPLDGGAGALVTDRRSVRADPPPALSRPHVDVPLQTGVRAIDGLTTLGRGQRLGVFAGSGVGKSSLMGQILGGTDADITVLCLVGERGREVRGFLDKTLSPEARNRTVCVCATSDRSPIERYLAPFVALTIAEFFRDQSWDVLMVMDSITRFAQASREVALSAGEAPVARGYPPSVFNELPKVLERVSASKERPGSITGIFSVLVEGDDHNEPVSDCVRSVLDGHINLSKDIASLGRYPAIDILTSVSRVADRALPDTSRELAREARSLISRFEDSRELRSIGAYQRGSDPELDRAVALVPHIYELISRPGSLESGAGEEPFAQLSRILTAS